MRLFRLVLLIALGSVAACSADPLGASDSAGSSGGGNAGSGTSSGAGAAGGGASTGSMGGVAGTGSNASGGMAGQSGSAGGNLDADGAGGAPPSEGGAGASFNEGGTDGPTADAAPGDARAPGDVRATEGATDARRESGVADGSTPTDSVVWAIDNLQSIGGHPTSVSGSPVVIDTPAGKAVQFDGVDDALFVEKNPIAGFSRFTVEVIFRPDAGGQLEQRFFHITEIGNNNRVLFETRLPGGGVWALDTFVESTAGGAALLDLQLLHPIGPFYHAAVVVDGTRVRHYVNGVEEVAVPLAFQPHVGGRTSIGVRVNQISWYKGAIRLARFTPRVLAPADFLPAN